MVPRRNREQAEATRAVRRFLLPTAVAALAMLAGLFVFQRVERFFHYDARFTLRRAEPGALHSPDLRIAGVEQAAAENVRAAFAGDEGRSVFLIPVAERRAKVSAVAWVKDARVSRIWPNRLDVQVLERTPVAFVHLAGRRRKDATRVALIDDEGVLLAIRDRKRWDLPLLTGVSEHQDADTRRHRVRLMGRLVAELGPMAKPVSEIDVTEPNNVKLIYPTGEKVLTLLLGNHDWKARMEKFLRYYPEIRRKMPKAIQLDLRLDDKITATEWEPDAAGEESDVR